MNGFGRLLLAYVAIAAAVLCGLVLLFPLPPVSLRATAVLFPLVLLGLARQAILLREPAPGRE